MADVRIKGSIAFGLKSGFLKKKGMMYLGKHPFPYPCVLIG
jgi:hypothetical protein